MTQEQVHERLLSALPAPGAESGGGAQYSAGAAAGAGPLSRATSRACSRTSEEMSDGNLIVNPS